MRIAIASADVDPSGGSGGIARYTQHLAEGLQGLGEGHQITVIGSSEEYSSLVKDTGVRYVYLPRRVRPYSVRKLRFIADIFHRSQSLSKFLLTEGAFDIVEFPVWNAEGFFYLRRRRTGTVVRGHTPHAVVNQLTAESGSAVARSDILIAKIEAIAAKKSALFLANSISSLESSRNLLRIDPKKAQVCYHGIPMPLEVRPAKPSPELNILFIGRLEPRKGIEFLLDAFPMVLSHVPNARLHIAGSDLISVDGSSYESRFRANTTPDLAKAVRFWGRVTDEELDNLLVCSDIVCLPSLYESFGLVHLEAMSYARPVVAFDIPTTSELIKSGATGLLVQPKNVNQLSEALLRLATNADLRYTIGSEARKSVEERFSVHAMATSVAKAYQTLL